MTDSTSPIVQTHSIASDTVDIVVDDYAPGAGVASAGAPLLLLHGGGQTRHSWASTARRLSELGRRVLTMDLRGHGDSSWDPDGRYQLSDHSTDAAAVIDWLGAEPVLVGASLGGLTGLALEGDHRPGSIQALVLVDIVPRMSMDGVDRIRSFMRANVEQGFASLDEAADAVAAYNPHRPRPANHDGLRKNLRERGGRWYWHWDPRTMTGNRPQVTNADYLSDALAAITAPVMLVRGRMSDLVTADIAAEFLAEHPTVRYTDGSDAGHMVAGDRNDVFTNAVEAFVLELDRAQ